MSNDRKKGKLKRSRPKRIHKHRHLESSSESESSNISLPDHLKELEDSSSSPSRQATRQKYYKKRDSQIERLRRYRQRYAPMYKGKLKRG